jgi:hypothetical protein
VSESGFHWRDDQVFVTIDRWTLAEELWLFGEDTAYLKTLDMSDDDLLRVWTLAGRILSEADSGSVAAARAAIVVIEGRERPLTRARRRPRSKLPKFDVPTEQRLDDVHRIEVAAQFPHPWT